MGFACASICVFLPPAHAQQSTVEIVIVARESFPPNVRRAPRMIEANILRRVAGGEGSHASATRLDIGRYSLREESCDSSIEYRASADTIFLSPKDGWKPCVHPDISSEIVFEFTPMIAFLDRAELQDVEFWRNALPGDPQGGTEAATYLSETFASAIANNQYGTVAILSAEMAHQYARQGLSDERNLFYSLSVEATAVGANEALARDEGWTKLLAVAPDFSRIELSPMGKEYIEAFQRSNVGISASHPEFGKTGWNTMRSLPGNSDRTAVDLNAIPDTLPVVDMDFVRGVITEGR